METICKKVAFVKIDFTNEFARDFQTLEKRYRTLKGDFEVFIRTQIYLYHKKGIDNGGTVRVSGLGIQSPEIYKARKFACRSLKDRGAASGIRVIYAYFSKENRIEFVEIYYKGDKDNEDRKRIIRHYGNRALGDCQPR